MNYVIFFVSFMIVCSCAKNQYVLHDTDILEYRSSIASIEMNRQNVTSQEELKEQKTKSYQQIYSLWYSEHVILEQKIEQGGLLNTVESHRKVQEHLDHMHEYLNFEQSQKLLGYQKLYDNLLEDYKKGVSPRVLRPRYRHLRKNIQKYY